MDPLPDFLTRNQFGAIRLTGSRIDLELVVYFHNAGESPEAIVERFPSLDLEQVNKTVAFYHAHRAAVDAYVAEGDAKEAQLRAANPGPDKEAMRRRFAAVLTDWNKAKETPGVSG
jgi:uncharacterized protein (DUF433 family)